MGAHGQDGNRRLAVKAGAGPVGEDAKSDARLLVHAGSRRCASAGALIKRSAAAMTRAGSIHVRHRKSPGAQTR